MHRIWNGLGRLAFFASIPLLHIYLRAHKRTRVLVISEGKVLLVKGWLGSGKWILPGGGRHNGESAASGVIRELEEETGIVLDPKLLRDMGEAKFAHYGLRYVYEQFIVELPAITKARIRRPEIIDAAWLPIEEINDKNSDADVLRLLGVWKGMK